jgi:hypothetical protein
MSAQHLHHFEWRDCDKKGHEAGCYIGSCEVDGCSYEVYDCEDGESKQLRVEGKKEVKS